MRMRFLKGKTMKVSELIGKQLDYWVAKSEIAHWDKQTKASYTENWISGYLSTHAPSTNWLDGGRIIEREAIALCKIEMPETVWLADITRESRELARAGGETPLEAAMRCYVESKFGNEVPDEFGY